jgi:multicomponent K+:H+ antiporter subunit E
VKRWIPHPVAAAVVLAMWLLLNQSLAPGQLALGAIVGLAASHAYAALRPEPVTFAAFRPMLRLAGIVAADIARSNLAVARIVLFPKKRVSGFVSVPLDLRNLNGLAILACIVTATPGTLWVRLDRSSGILLVHVLDLVDEEEWVRLIKDRYEALLLQIFGR